MCGGQVVGILAYDGVCVHDVPHSRHRPPYPPHGRGGARSGLTPRDRQSRSRLIFSVTDLRLDVIVEFRILGLHKFPDDVANVVS